MGLAWNLGLCFNLAESYLLALLHDLQRLQNDSLYPSQCSLCNTYRLQNVEHAM